jgi:hypothetical protein
MGVLFEHVAAALSDAGQPGLEDWPYNQGLGAGTEDPPEGVGPPPWQTIDAEHFELAHDGVESEVEGLLDERRLIVLIIEVTAEFEEPDEDDHIVIPDLRAPAGDYHAVVAAGVATHDGHGRCLLIRNSWGTGWGASGYAWMPLEYLETFAVQAGVVRFPGAEKQREEDGIGP